jgi:hypothetical protein
LLIIFKKKSQPNKRLGFLNQNKVIIMKQL